MPGGFQQMLPHSSLTQRHPNFGKGKEASRDRFRPLGLQLRLLDHEGGLSRSGEVAST